MADFWRTFSQKINLCESAKYDTFLFKAVLRALSTGNTKHGTRVRVVPARITTGRGTEGPENGTYREKRDGWQPYISSVFANLEYVYVL